jgi:hypothetical protein
MWAISRPLGFVGLLDGYHLVHVEDRYHMAYLEKGFGQFVAGCVLGLFERMRRPRRNGSLSMNFTAFGLGVS